MMHMPLVLFIIFSIQKAIQSYNIHITQKAMGSFPPNFTARFLVITIAAVRVTGSIVQTMALIITVANAKHSVVAS